MSKEDWNGYHCKICFERSVQEKARRNRLLRAQQQKVTKEQPPPKDPPPPQVKMLKPQPKGCVFAKSCTLPKGEINHRNPTGFVPVEPLQQYGTFAVLGTGTATTSTSAALKWIGGSGDSVKLARLLRGTLALAGATSGGVVALLVPSDTSADSAYYTAEQYALLAQGNTRVRVNVKQLPNGSVSVYGFYTGTKNEWQQVPVVAAKLRNEERVAEIGQGVQVIWTPAIDSNEVLGIPKLEGASLRPRAWVYPPTEQADKILVNPEHPPDYLDAIIWFPDTAIQPIYISLSLDGHRYHPKPASLPAYPDARWAKSKTPVQGGGGLRPRWKSRDGTIYEWDFQHGSVEVYDKRGKHRGEYNPETGVQNKPADPTRKVEP